MRLGRRFSRAGGVAVGHRQEMLDVIFAFTGQQSMLTVPRALLDFTGDLNTALLLSQIVFWSDAATIEGGWIAKNYEDMRIELGLPEYTVRKSAAWLREEGLLETCVRKFGGAPTVHYRLCLDTFSERFSAFLRNRRIETAKSKDGNCEIKGSFLRNQRINPLISQDGSCEIKGTLNKDNNKEDSKDNNKKQTPSTEAVPEAGVVVVFPAALVSELVTAGVTRRTAEKLIRAHGEAEVRRQLDALPSRKCEDQAATLVKAIQEDWRVPLTSRKAMPRPKLRPTALAEQRNRPEMPEGDTEGMRVAIAEARKKTKLL